MSLWFFVASTFVVGLLFLDIVPLQETMVCSDYKNKTTCPEVYFSQTYREAREKFLAAAKQASPEVLLGHHLVFSTDTHSYFTDTALFRGTDPSRLLVHVSGSHGVEGYTGSAIQAKMLSRWNETHATGPSVLFVHAVNPYGMAQYRLENENNVDVHRNFVSSAGKVPTHRDGDAPAQFPILKRAPRVIDRYVALLPIIKEVVRQGLPALREVQRVGQNTNESALFYRGSIQQNSTTILKHLLQTHCAGVEQVLILDVHTGVGSFSADTMVVHRAADAEKVGHTFTAPVRTAYNDAGRVFHGSMTGRLDGGDVCGAAETLVVSEEFGTVLEVFTARAVMLEHAARLYASGSYVHTMMRQWLRDAFYPQERSYKGVVLDKGVKAIEEALTYLRK